MCTSILIGNDEFELNETWKQSVDEVYSDFGSLGERVLGKNRIEIETDCNEMK